MKPYQREEAAYSFFPLRLGRHTILKISIEKFHEEHMQKWYQISALHPKEQRNDDEKHRMHESCRRLGSAKMYDSDAFFVNLNSFSVPRSRPEAHILQEYVALF